MLKKNIMKMQKKNVERLKTTYKNRLFQEVSKVLGTSKAQCLIDELMNCNQI